jgi:hypothetical protein
LEQGSHSKLIFCHPAGGSRPHTKAGPVEIELLNVHSVGTLLVERLLKIFRNCWKNYLNV